MPKFHQSKPDPYFDMENDRGVYWLVIVWQDGREIEELEYNNAEAARKAATHLSAADPTKVCKLWKCDPLHGWTEIMV